MLLAQGLTGELALERLLDLLPLMAVTVIGVALLEIAVYLFFKKVLRSRFTLPYTLVAPAALALLLFTVYPFVYNIRLAFSDLRLKTMACYIPNTDVTNAECSLGRAAPGAEVNIRVNEYPVRAEPNETADVLWTVEEGDEVRVTGQSSKINNYVRYAGSPVHINEDGTLSNRVCGVDINCKRTFDEYKANVLDVQDERDWWPIEDGTGQTGWIPNQIFYITEDTQAFGTSTGDEEIVTEVSQGDEARLVRAERTTWYELQLEGDQTGWVPAEMIDSRQSFFPEAEAEVYEEMTAGSPVLDTLSAEQEVGLVQAVTMTWYQIFADEETIGWINIPVQNISTIQTFTLPAEAEVYAEQNTDTAPVATVPEGVQVTLLQTMVVTDEEEGVDVTWHQVQLEDETTGWLTGITPTDLSEVEVMTLDDETTLYSETSAESDVIGTAPAGQRVTVIERDDSNDITWRRVRLDGNEMGWVNVGGETATNFSIAEDTGVFAEIGGAGGVVAERTEGQRVTLVNDDMRTFTRYQVRLRDGTVGWVNQRPREVTTTQRDIVLYSLNYGWTNFKRVFVKTNNQTGEIEGWGRLLQTQNSTFPRLMRTTVAWTSLNVLFHLIFGMILALMLNRPGLKLRGIYRAIIILPWAIPQVIIALAWKGEFHYQYGFVNNLLVDFGLDRINWLFSPGPAFAAVTFVNIWLGIPFYMVTLLGGLQSIAGEYYEAAEIDGANSWQRFRNVTVPLIRPVAVPIVTLDVIWTFNNFNVIYLITKGEPNESTNILVTALYNAAFGENGQFQLGFAAAFSLVIFLVLFLFASFWVTSSGALKGVYES